MSYSTTVYTDEFCCLNIEEVSTDELVDTIDGFTFMTVYKCKKCKRMFNSYSGNGRFEGIEEVDYDD